MLIKLPRKIRRIFWKRNTIETIYQGWTDGNQLVVVTFKNGCSRKFIKKFNKYWFIANTNTKANDFEVRGIKKVLTLLRKHGMKTSNGKIYVRK